MYQVLRRGKQTHQNSVLSQNILMLHCVIMQWLRGGINPYWCLCCTRILEPNQRFFSKQYCNITMQCCNVDVQIARCTMVKLYSSYYKINGKFVPQAYNICMFNFQINSKHYLACEPIGKYVYNYDGKFLQATCTSILQHRIAILLAKEHLVWL